MFNDEIESKTFETNVIIKLGEEYYGNKQPDTGLIIPTENLILDDPFVKPVTVDLRKVNTPIGSFTFKLKDNQGVTTAKIMSDSSNFLEKPVTAYIGFKTGSYDFSEYKEIAQTITKSVTKVTNGYSFRSQEITSALAGDTFNVADQLNINILSVSLSLTLDDVTGFASSGLIKIGNEFIRYDGIINTTLQNLVRGQLSTVAASHVAGTPVYYVTEFEGINPIDIFLTMALSKDGDLLNDPTYDILPNGMGLTSNEIDVAKFESLRTEHFLGEQYRLYLYNESNSLKWLEKEIFRATNIRVFTLYGKISAAVLDQPNAAGVPELNENSIVGTPTWSLGSDKVTNVVTIKYAYDEALKTFTKFITEKDEDSIELFGEKKPLVFEFKGLVDDFGGGAIALNRATSFLTRFSSARSSIKVKAHLDAILFNIGDKAILNHRFLPQQGAGLGIYDQLEVMSLGMDLKGATASLSFEYTSFSGLRIPFIAPSPLIESVIDQKTVEVLDGTCYAPGFGIRLWDVEAHTYFADAVNRIVSITGNILTFENDFTTILTTNIRLKMSDYNETSKEQKGRYASIGENSGFFDDETKSYQIIP